MGITITGKTYPNPWTVFDYFISGHTLSISCQFIGEEKKSGDLFFKTPQGTYFGYRWKHRKSDYPQAIIWLLNEQPLI